MDWETTMSPREMTATSVVPPPMSMIRLPVGSLRETGADRGRHRLLDQIGLARARAQAGLLDRALLYAGHAGGNAHDHPGMGEAAVIGAFDEVAEHRLRDLEVGDHAVLQGSHGVDRGRGAAEHLLRLGPNRVDLAGGDVHRHDRRLGENDAAAADVDQGVRRAEVDGHVAGWSYRR